MHLIEDRIKFGERARDILIDAAVYVASLSLMRLEKVLAHVKFVSQEKLPGLAPQSRWDPFFGNLVYQVFALCLSLLEQGNQGAKP